MKIFIIHGTKGSPSGNWFPWLKAELEKTEHEVFVPRFPTPDGQSLGSWLKVLNDYEFGDDLILIGHSLAVPFILTFLEENQAEATFLVSGFINILGMEEFDALNKTFVQRDFAWQKIKSNCEHFEIFHGDNDPYVPLKHSEKIAEKLGIDINMVKNGGHLNEEEGYSEFPLLLSRIKPFVEKSSWK